MIKEYLFCAISASACLLSQHIMASTPVSVKTVKQQTIDIPLRSVGSIESLNTPTISAEVAGKIGKIYVHIGSTVKQGDLLVYIQESEMQLKYSQAMNKISNLKSKLAENSFVLKRFQKAYKKNAVSLEDLKKKESLVIQDKENLEIAEQTGKFAKQNLEKDRVRSPIEGQVQKIYVAEGDYVTSGTKLLTLVDHKQLRAVLPFSQKDFHYLKVGQHVTLTSSASDRIQYKGTITAIEPSINADTRSFNVFIKFANNHNWYAGLSASAVVYLNEPINVFIIPRQSVILKNNDYIVYYVKNNKAYEEKVTILHYWKNKVAIKANQKSPITVVVDGAYYLDNGSSIKVVGK